MAITTEEQFIAAIRDKKVNIELESNCSHHFGWSCYDVSEPVWSECSNEPCYCDAVLYMDGEKVGYIDGWFGNAFYFVDGNEVVVKNITALEEALDAYGWKHEEREDFQHWNRVGRLETCREPTTEEAKAFLEKEGFTCFYVDTKRDFCNEWRLYLSKACKPEFEHALITFDSWRSADIEEAASKLALMCGREVEGDMSVEALENCTYNFDEKGRVL